MNKELKMKETNITFAGLPYCKDFSAVNADIGIIGIPYLTPQPYGHLPFGTAAVNEMLASLGDPGLGANSIRIMSQKYTPLITHYDFDLNGDLLDGGRHHIVDCGDVDLSSQDDVNRWRAENAVMNLLDQGVVPIVLGGDHATTIPCVRALKNHGPVCLVHIDAHLDFRDEVGGVKEGLSSPIRRASEMPWIQSIYQIGLRGLGSARPQDVRDAINNGNVIVRAEEMHSLGIQEVLKRLPSSERYYLTLDVDGLDPTIAPEVGGPGAGGLTYYQTVALMRELTKRGSVVGADFVELAVDDDFKGRTGLLVARLVLVLMGLILQREKG